MFPVQGRSGITILCETAEEAERLRARLWRRIPDDAVEKPASTAYRITQAQLAAEKAEK